ncbi:hypothetical protein PV11_06936 [Exophiala sideris]|uniref:Major facilitator superfamily (MFS) profile domain-containing protein n=1 Tax=Exophiala sideris TaxID=1016849 RepID=A0A0D1YX42_9EURO|nr:hypothetical protein PV11_06936 [Exophiala sideris]
MAALCMLGMGLACTCRGIDIISGRIIVSMTIIFLFFYGNTVSPYSAQVAGEIPSQPLRAYTMAFSWSVSFFFGWLLTFTAPYFINPTALNWGAQYAYIWAPTNLLCAAFTFFFVPETNKRTLEEIDECYNKKIPIRKFKSYQSVDTVQARREVVNHQALVHRQKAEEGVSV